MLQVLLQDRQTATVSLPCKQSVGVTAFSMERAQLAPELAKQKSHYQRCAASIAARRLRYLRCSIRSTENKIRTIDYMLDSLARRFPDVDA